MPRPFNDPYEEPATEPDLRDPCAICGRELWSDGLPPVFARPDWPPTATPELSH